MNEQDMQARADEAAESILACRDAFRQVGNSIKACEVSIAEALDELVRPIAPVLDGVALMAGGARLVALWVANRLLLTAGTIDATTDALRRSNEAAGVPSKEAILAILERAEDRDKL